MCASGSSTTRAPPGSTLYMAATMGNAETMPDPAESISTPKPDGSLYRTPGSPSAGDVSSDPLKSLENMALAASSSPPEIVSSTVL